MLAVAKSRAVSQTDYQQALARAMELVAHSPEDYLFPGHAEILLDPERGFSLTGRGDTPPPFCSGAAGAPQRSAAASSKDVPGLERARQATEDAKWIKQYLPENPVVLSETVLTHLSCSHVFGQFGSAAEREAALEEGWKDARALRRFPGLPAAVLARWFFVEGTDQEETVVDELRRVTETTQDSMVSANYAEALYDRGKYDQAYAVMSRMKGESVLDLLPRDSIWPSYQMASAVLTSYSRR